MEGAMDRREFLRRLGLASGAVMVDDRAEEWLWLGSKGVRAVEVPTVTQVGSVITWQTRQPCPSLLQVLSPDGSKSHFESAEVVEDHGLAVTGLRASTDYRFQLLSPTNGQVWYEGRFRTLPAAEGKRLARFAVIADPHGGEMEAGHIGFPDFSFTKGYKSWDPNNPHWRFTLRACLEEINALGPDLLVFAGDLSTHDKPEEYRLVRTLLEDLRPAFPVFYARGNHDIPHAQTAEDNFKKGFGLEESFQAFPVGEVAFLLPDFIDRTSKTGRAKVRTEDLRRFSDDLKKYADRPTFVINHHQLLSRRRPIDWADTGDADRLIDVLLREGNPWLMLCGHVHGADLTLLGNGGRIIPQVALPACKDYPCGYGLVTVYEHSVQYNFHRPLDPWCLRWTNLTRGMYYGLAPKLNYGRVGERNALFMRG